MKCPLCGEELVDAGDAEYIVNCRNEKCPFGENWQRVYGSEELFTIFAQTKESLDVAIDALKIIRRYTAINQFKPKSKEAHFVSRKAIDKIKHILEIKE